jgi:predicted HicB family RNase H-like nuclease
MNLLKYKGYLGEFEYDPDAEIFHGRVININDVVTFQGTSVDELKASLTDSVEDYLAFCTEMGKEPEKPYSGKFNVRLRPEVHRAAALAAKMEKKSLNAWVAEKVETALENPF